MPASNSLSISIPNNPALNGTEGQWQTLFIDSASTSTGLLITASRGMMTPFSL